MRKEGENESEKSLREKSHNKYNRVQLELRKNLQTYSALIKFCVLPACLSE